MSRELYEYNDFTDSDDEYNKKSFCYYIICMPCFLIQALCCCLD